ncbi:complement C1q domain-containing protein [Myroides sp. LJL116]
MKIKKIIYSIGCFFTLFSVVAQVQIGTKNSNHAMEVKTTGDTTIITNDGKVGVGNASPILNLDLRSLSQDGTLALGWTDQSASQAGKGALRYNPAVTWGGINGYIEYSDGNVWVPFYPKGKPRIVVMAEKNTNNVRVDQGGFVDAGNYTGGVPPRTSTFPTNWTKRVDMDSGVAGNYFDATKGEFKAPRTGMYLVTFTFALAKAPVEHEEHNYWEAIWQVIDKNGQHRYDIKSNNGYPSDSGSAPNGVVVGSYCTAMVFLEQGDVARPYIWGKTEYTNGPYATGNSQARYDKTKRPFILNSGFNVLTVIEL